MKLSHTLVYSFLSFFIVTAVFSQNNTRNSNNNSNKKIRVGAITGGSDNICAGSKTQFIIANHVNHSDHSGKWSVSNTQLATVTNKGLVTALKSGVFTLKYDSNDSRCEGDSYRTITVNAGAAVNVTGPSVICINSTTVLSPTTGGTWSSSNSVIASVSSSGVVRGISPGSATFIFTKAGGCASLPTSAVTVSAAPTVNITGANSICINGTTKLSPTTGGTWSSSNTRIASVSNDGIVTGLSVGSATFTFTKIGGCMSLPTRAVIISSCPVGNITGPSVICVNGTTTLSPTTGGTWTSSNKAVATVTNLGVVKGISAGSATFTYTKTGTCSSLATPAVTVNSIPVVSVTGSSSICINGTTKLSPTTDGTWSSSNTRIATVSNDGTVTGLSVGSATFTFTKTGGCTSLATRAVTVNSCPVGSITGPSAICIDGTTTLSPTTGGIWTSSNKAVATVTNSGVVKGISVGSATFTYTKTGTCSSLATPAVTVNASPVVSITGSNSVCIGGTTSLSPTAAGTWSSSNPAVATVNNSGVVIGVSAGTATFTFTKSDGCASLPTAAVTVNGNLAASISGANAICINSTTTLSPSTGGTWSSSNPAVATVNNSGIVTGVSAGTATFTFTKSDGCASLPTAAVTVNGNLAASISGANTICINSTTTLSPSTGGTWSSSNPAVATVNNSGVVTGVSAGTATFTFTKPDGCASLPTAAVTVNGNLAASISGANTICINSTTTLSPSTGGTWSSSNPAVATVNNSGVVTGVSAGTATFTFTKPDGCASLPTAAVTVNGNLAASISGANTICINSTTTLSPSTGGTWSSSNPAVATVNNSGVVTGVSAGTATFTFTKPDGCASLPTAAVTVNGNLAASISGANTICINSTTTLSPSTGGTWSSSNPAVATVNNSGVVTGVSAGTATFTFTKSDGCASLPTAVITVNTNPTVRAIIGGSNITVGSTTQLENNTTSGVWSVTNISGSATVSTTGLVTGITVGTVKINYTVEKEGCKGSATPYEITINETTVLKSIAGPDTVSISQSSVPFQNETAGGIWSVKNGSGAATVTPQGVIQGTKEGTVEIVYTFTDAYGVTNSVSKEITVLSPCTATNSNSLVVQKLFQNLVRHLYNRACKADAATQINGSNPAELIALKPYIKNSIADKIYNFSYLKTDNDRVSISFSFSPASGSDVVYTGNITANCPTDADVINGLAVVLNSYNSYNDLFHYANGSGTEEVLFEVKNIDFCPNAVYKPVAGKIIASIEKPTTSDNISFSFEQELMTLSAKKTSSLFSASDKSISYTTAINLIYKWLFYELDNVTPRETITDPIALQRFSIPGNYRVILIVKDENGFETTFYRDVIVTQTCEPIIGKIIITN
jgi:uncharacterized protein YjdB